MVKRQSASQATKNLFSNSLSWHATMKRAIDGLFQQVGDYPNHRLRDWLTRCRGAGEETPKPKNKTTKNFQFQSSKPSHFEGFRGWIGLDFLHSMF
ncbi:MAG: hypothetical protein JWM68_1011 [Verrucomicrobiales bacterium]|nr:hypothetical protein [Verrucomicrobiales bacterium]